MCFAYTSELQLSFTKLITIHPEGDINVCSKFHGNPFNSRGDISLKTTNVNKQCQRIIKVNKFQYLYSVLSQPTSYRATYFAERYFRLDPNGRLADQHHHPQNQQRGYNQAFFSACSGRQGNFGQSFMINQKRTQRAHTSAKAKSSLLLYAKLQPPIQYTVYVCISKSIRIMSKYGCAQLKRQHHLLIIIYDPLEVYGGIYRDCVCACVVFSLLLLWMFLGINQLPVNNSAQSVRLDYRLKTQQPGYIAVSVCSGRVMDV